MRLLISIDDTDNLESKGTGELAESMAMIIVKNAWGERDRVTRHQLLVHPDIPYTSHNSSMCFAAEIMDEYYSAMAETYQSYLQRQSAAGSDPGLCIVKLDTISAPEALIAFGQQAKREILSKERAYSLAYELGVHLSEHGGTGDGVIGALAGAGLRLSGNDGRFRGKMKIADPGVSLSTREIIEISGIDGLITPDGRRPAEEDQVVVEEWVKAVLLDGQCLLLVEDNQDFTSGSLWRTAGKQRLKRY